MTNRITTIIMIIAIVLLTYTAYMGIEIGEFEVLSVEALKEKSTTLNEKIEEASNLTSKDFTESVKTLEKTYESYLTQKQKYEQIAGFSGQKEEGKYETKQYDIAYLWRVFGKYASEKKHPDDKGLKLNIQVTKSKAGESTYDFNFNVEGEYTRISQFITDLENDSDLYFRIHDFKMTSRIENDGNRQVTVIIANFTVKDINVNPATITNQATIK